MGLRGPASAPTALKLLRGNPGHRPLPKNEPKPREVRPYCPEHVKSDKVAYREWKRLLPILRRMRVLTEADYITLGNICITYSTMIAAQNAIAELRSRQNSVIAGIIMTVGKKQITRKHKDGSETTTDSPGFPQINPLLSIVSNSITTITKLCREFGLTPAARANVQTTGGQDKPEDPWNQF